MKKSPDLSQSLKAIPEFFARFHAIIFFVVIGGALAAALLIVISIVGSSSEISNSGLEAINTKFDEDTMKKLDELQDAKNDISPLPSGRINPLSDS